MYENQWVKAYGTHNLTVSPQLLGCFLLCFVMHCFLTVLGHRFSKQASPAVVLSSRVVTQASLVMACGFSCPMACGILFHNHVSNTHPLHQKVDSLPLDHYGSPHSYFWLQRNNCNCTVGELGAHHRSQMIKDSIFTKWENGHLVPPDVILLEEKDKIWLAEILTKVHNLKQIIGREKRIWVKSFCKKKPGLNFSKLSCSRNIQKIWGVLPD